MLRYFFAFFAVVVIVISVLYFISPVRPVHWDPDPTQALSGWYEKNNLLANAEVFEIQGEGPEDIIFDDQGNLYTGLIDGSLIKLLPPQYSKSELITNTGGRPLGLRFANTRDLIVADAVKGLLRVDVASGEIDILANEFEGKPINFVDHLDIADNGDIYFSDASQRFSMHNYTKDFIESSATGRVLKYEKSTGSLRLIAENLFFANGVALGPNDDYLLINETGRARILKVHKRGTRYSKPEIFKQSLPGMPDNIFFNEQTKSFWVGIIAKRDWRIEKLSHNLFLRRIIGNIPSSLLEKTAPFGMAIELDEDANVISNLQTEKDIVGVTSAVSDNQYLYIGFLRGNKIARMRLNQIPENCLGGACPELR